MSASRKRWAALALTILIVAAPGLLIVKLYAALLELDYVPEIILSWLLVFASAGLFIAVGTTVERVLKVPPLPPPEPEMEKRVSLDETNQ